MMKDEKRTHYDAIKEFNGHRYSGMKVGGSHSWLYPNGLWSETKVSPDKWQFGFTCDKHRIRQAPMGTGALNDTEYHWYIIADQRVKKLDENTYRTEMTGQKYKVAHKRPNWNHWSYQYCGEAYEDRIIRILEDVLRELKTRKERRDLLGFLK
jgi:hypothetical protein